MNRTAMVFVTVLSLLFSCSSLMADPITGADAKLAAVGWLRIHPQPLGTPLGQDVVHVETFTNGSDQPMYHIVYLDPTGYVIVSADDQVEPIIGFVAEGVYTDDPDDPLCALVTADLVARTDAVNSMVPRSGVGAQSIDSVIREKWEWLWSAAEATRGQLSVASLSSIDEVWVDPLVQSTWGQTQVNGESCYNYYTPDGYPCGCVATAMAQVMRYHKWPDAPSAEVTSKFPLTVNGSEQRQVSLKGGDGSGGSYEWHRMPLRPDSSITETGRQAIAALCYDAGVASYTDYAQNGSGANFEDVKNALITIFGYEGVAIEYDMDYRYLQNINANLDAGYPVILGLLRRGNDNAGHAVVVDGYGYDRLWRTTTGTPYHHLNFGSSGICHVWYNLPEVDSSVAGPYNILAGCIYNISPSHSDYIVSGRIADAAGNPIPGVIVEVNLRGCPGTTTYIGPDGRAAIAGEEAVGQVVPPLPIPSWTVRTNDKGIYALSGVPPFGLGSAYLSIDYVGRAGYEFPGETIILDAIDGNRWGVDFVAVPTGFPMSPVIMRFDFEDGDTDTWTEGTYTCRTLVGSGAAGSCRSLTLIGGSRVHHNGVGETLGRIQPARCTFYVKAHSNDKVGGYFVLQGDAGDGNCIGDATFFYMGQNGYMGLYDGGRFWGTPYLGQTWYKIELVFHWQRRRVDYYVDERLIENAISFRSPKVLELRCIHLYNYDNTQAWWDEIEFRSE